MFAQCYYKGYTKEKHGNTTESASDRQDTGANVPKLSKENE